MQIPTSLSVILSSGEKKKKKKEDTEQHKVQDPSQLYTSWP